MIEKIFNFVLCILKYFLFIICFSLIVLGLFKIYGRLDKNILLFFNVLLPFILNFFVLIIDLFMKNDIIKKNLLFNFVSNLVFMMIIIICLRAQYDLSLVLNIRYGISYNTLFLSDNLNSIIIILYILFTVNLLMIIYSILDSKKRYVEEVIARKINY